MKPTIGRVVHYRHETSEQWLAAIVTQVDPGVHLTVFRPSHAPFTTVGFVVEGTEPGCWRWPPRETEDGPEAAKQQALPPKEWNAVTEAVEVMKHAPPEKSPVGACPSHPKNENFGDLVRDISLTPENRCQHRTLVPQALWLDGLPRRCTGLLGHPGDKHQFSVDEPPVNPCKPPCSLVQGHQGVCEPTTFCTCIGSARNRHDVGCPVQQRTEKVSLADVGVTPQSTMSAREIACVNAMAGISDPIAYIARVNSLLDMLMSLRKIV